MNPNFIINIYDCNELERQLNEWGATDAQLTRRILETCGCFAGEHYIMLDNRFAGGDHNPVFAAAQLFDAAFNREDAYEVFLAAVSQTGISAVEPVRAARKLGLVLVNYRAK